MKLVFSVVLLLVANVLLCQVVWDEPLLIRDNENLEWNKWSSLATDDNAIVHVWSEIQDGSRQIRIMKFDNQGNPLWSEEPMLLAESNYNQTDSRIIATNDDCFIVTWIEHENPQSIMAQKIDESGNLLWSENGVFVSDQFDVGSEDRILLFPNENGGAVITWLNDTTMAKSLDSNGINQWGGTDDALDLGNISYSNQIISDGHGSLIIVDIEVDPNFVSVTRFDTTGVLLWNQNITLDFPQNDRRKLRIVYNNIDSYYLILDDFEDSIATLDVRKISLTGEIDPYIANVPLMESPYPFYIINYATNDNGNLFIISKSLISSNFEYSWNAINLNQNLYQVWNNSGIYLDSISNFSKDNIDIIATNSDELYFTMMIDSEMDSDYIDYDFKLIKIDSNGDIQTDDSGLLINQFNSYEFDSYLAYNNELIIISFEFRDGFRNLVQKVFDDNLQSAISEENEIIIHSITGGLSYYYYAFHLPDSERSVIIWLDYTFNMNYKIKYQIINSDGSYELTEGGLDIAEFTNSNLTEEDYDIRYISVVQNDSGQICIVWNADSYGVIMSRIIDSDGSLLGNEYGEEINSSLESLRQLSVSTNNNAFYVSWLIEDTSANEKYINGIKCNNDLQWGEPYTIDTSQGSTYSQYRIENTVNNYCIIKTNNQTFKAIKITDQGDFLEENLVLIGNDQKFVADDNNNLFYIWNTDHQIFLQGITNSGNQYWDDSIIVIDNSTTQNEIYITNTEILITDEINIVWSETNFTVTEMKVQKLSYSGEKLWDEEGILLNNEIEYGGWYDNFIKDVGDGYIIVGLRDDSDFGVNYEYNLMNSDGDIIYVADGSELAGELPEIYILDFVKLPDQRVLSVWSQYNENISGFYAQLLDFTSVANENNDIAPMTMSLMQNYPNPFNPETNISFQVPNSGQVNLDIYNIKGQKVKTLVNDIFSAGRHSVVWNGRDDSNKEVASGLYLYKMRSGKYSSTKKMILMK